MADLNTSEKVIPKQQQRPLQATQREFNASNKNAILTEKNSWKFEIHRPQSSYWVRINSIKRLCIILRRLHW